MTLLMMARELLSQHFNWELPGDRAILQNGTWNPDAKPLALDEIHKKPEWKNWLKGVVVGRLAGQSVLVTGKARMEHGGKVGTPLVGRYFAYRLHPLRRAVTGLVS